MKSELAIFNGSTINRYGIRFSIETLESALNQTWGSGVPSCISHDLHRPFAWSKSLALHIECGLVRLIGLVYVPENDEDIKIIQQKLQIFISENISKNFEPYRKKLEGKLSGYLTGQAKPLMLSRVGCIAFQDIGIAKRIFKEIFAQQDRDGLVSLSTLNPIAPGVFEKDGLLFFAHHFFRRSLSRFNSLNSPFLKILQSLAKEKYLDTKILLDEDFVGLSESFLEDIELEYWWGPKFNDNLGEIQTGVVTKHESNESERFFYGISGTEFWWHRQNNILTLECEELRNIPTLGVRKDSFGCRYVHSMLNSKSIPYHIDGAIRLYDEESMLKRLENNIAVFGRHSKYTKLWRVDAKKIEVDGQQIDGNIDLSLWKNLLTHYFRDNHLVGEYLGGKDDENKLLYPHTISPTTYYSPLYEYVPCNMDSGQGIRISVSYHPRMENYENYKCIVLPYYIPYGDTKRPYIETDSIDILKAIKRKKVDIYYPEDTLFIAFEDMILNLPLIIHTGEEPVKLASQTQNIIATFCKIWISRNDDRVIVYNIGIRYSDRDVYFSFAGHINDITSWLSTPNSAFPENVDQIGTWCNNATSELTKLFSESKDCPPLNEHLNKTGLLHFNRRFLQHNEYEIKFDENSKSIKCNFSIPKENKELISIISSGTLKPAPAFLIKKSKCSKCGFSYKDCDCIKYFDKAVVENVVDATMFGVFWTNRKD